MTRPVPRPTEIDVIANTLFGPDERAEPLPSAGSSGVHAALERVLIDALERKPCVVSFSGGRDSSAVLALAVDVARRHGLAMPIPVTMRFRDVPAADEAAWQEQVLGHIGVADHEVLELDSELDALGPAATEVLCRQGLLWPGNSYMHRPVIDVARGGALLTGVGGDELFSTTAPRRSPGQLAVAALPRRARAAVWRARHRPDSHWLTPTGQARVQSALAWEEVTCPYPWDKALRHWYGSRAFAALNGALSIVAEGHDVTVVNPFIDRHVLAELAAAGGVRGFASRTEAMRWLCRGLLPEGVMSRPTKASFGGAVWGPGVRAFTAQWDGGGVDTRYVDVAKLKAELAKPNPDFRSIMLLHQAWLHTAAPVRDA